VRKFCDEYTGGIEDGEVEEGLDDQLIDEAILREEGGRDRGELGGRGEGLNRMMKRKSVQASRR